MGHSEVAGRCERQARQLQNGGTYRTTNNERAKQMRVGGIPDRCPNCKDVTGAGDGPEWDEEPEPGSPEDVAAWLRCRGYT